MIRQEALIECKNCQQKFTGMYCNNCGEKVYTDHDKSFKHIIEEYFHFISHFEGKFLTTLKTLFIQPGQLSLDYCNGIRKKYYPPLSLFLLLVILYLLFPVFRGLNISLESHLSHWLHGDYAVKKVSTIMEKKGWTLAAADEHFYRVSEKVSKFLLFITIPIMAVFSSMIYRKTRRPLFDHFIFSTEVNSFFIIWGFLLLAPLAILLSLLLKPFGWSAIVDNEGVLGILTIVPFVIFVRKASLRFFYSTVNKQPGKKGKSSWLWLGMTFKPLLFSILLITFLLTVYRFLLFFITIQLIR
jgi:hypothetical protein